MHLLSKSTYMRGRQCPKALWLYKHRRELVPPVDPARQAIYDTGTGVGLLAQQLFPGGVDCTPESARDFGPAIVATQRAIAEGAPVIYEAAFLHEGVLAALDILVKDADGWKAYEVKSSSNPKEYQWHDAALQAHVIEGNGIPLVDVSIVHLNSAYVRQGPIDVRQLFTITSVKKQVDAERKDIPARIAALKEVLQRTEEPSIAIGPQCASPFDCDFRAHCWADVPADGSVFQLSRAMGRDWELYQRGIVLLKDIPDEEPLTPMQRTQVAGAKYGTATIDRPSLHRWLGELHYPLHHLDFETVMPAVPMFDGTRPFQQLPFQYSLHIVRSPSDHAPDAEPEHRAFLADGVGDPRPAFVERLLADIGPEGHILAYNAPFEVARLRDLARDLPQHGPTLHALIARVKDLHTPFKAGWYTVPAMNGRTSIKVVLPALVPHLRYDELAVQEGGTASLLFTQLMSGSYTGDVTQLRADLLAYCALDTLAMVKVLGVLAREAGA